MGKRLTWLLHLSDAYQIFVWLLGGGTATLIASLVSYYYDYTVIANLLLAAAFLLAVLSIPALLLSPPKGSYFPRYRNYYSWPFRKISWRLGGVNVFDARDGREAIGIFTCSFRVNRGRINPQEFALEFDGKTISTPVTIGVGAKYMDCEQIKYIPKGIWNQCQARILKDASLPDDGVTNHPSTAEFMSQFGEFDLVFVSDGKTFRRRYSHYELDMMIQGQRAKHHPTASPMPILEDENHKDAVLEHAPVHNILDIDSKRLNALTELGETWEQATHFLNDIVKHGVLNAATGMTIRDFEVKIYEAVNIVCPWRISTFKTLGSYDKASHPPQYWEEKWDGDKTLIIFSERLLRVRRLIDEGPQSTNTDN